MDRVTVAAILAAFMPVFAEAHPYDPESSPQGHVPTLMHEIYADPEAAKDAAAADLAYVAGMRAHHQGAVTMAQAYLQDPKGRHPLMTSLARAIIHNQQFELAILDNVERHAVIPPRGGTLIFRQAGWDGLEHSYRFIKYPPPGPLELWLDRTQSSETDVRFAKGMIIHHQAALDMVRDYNAAPAADNRIIKALNRDISIDQTYEIRLLERLIERFPGDSGQIAPGEVHGMPGHHGQLH